MSIKNPSQNLSDQKCLPLFYLVTTMPLFVHTHEVCLHPLRPSTITSFLTKIPSLPLVIQFSLYSEFSSVKLSSKAFLKVGLHSGCSTTCKTEYLKVEKRTQPAPTIQRIVRKSWICQTRRDVGCEVCFPLLLENHVLRTQA